MVIKALIETEGLSLSLNEHYPFMDASESGSQNDPLSQSEEVQHVPSPQKKPLTKGERYFIRNTLSTLNSSLAPLKAHAKVEESEAECFIVILPLEGSSSIDGWTDKVALVQTEHFEKFSTESISFPNEKAKLGILELLCDVEAETMEQQKGSLIIAGSKEAVDRVFQEANKIRLQNEVTKDVLNHPKKHIKFLSKFYPKELKKVADREDVHVIHLDPDAETISVTANLNGHRKVKKFLELLSTAEEKKLQLSSSAYKLLSSPRGTEKLSEMFCMSDSQIVYDFEQTQVSADVQYHICFVSRNNKDLKTAKLNVKKYIKEERIGKISVAKIRVTSSKEWRELMFKLHDEHFVFVTVEEATQTIIITGDQLVCKNIKENVEKFLDKHTNVEEHVMVNSSKWFILKSHFDNELQKIKREAKTKQVNVEWPKHISSQSPLSILISGEPDVVDQIKSKVSELLPSVKEKMSRIRDVAAAGQVLRSIENEVRLLEGDEKVKVEIILENDNSKEPEATVRTEGVLLCVATSPSGSHVSIYTGSNLAQNAPVETILNFITSTPNTQVGHLNEVLESGGNEVIEDFRQKISEFVKLEQNTNFRTCSGQLKCSRLVHSVIPSWKDKESDDVKKEYCVEKALNAVMASTAGGSVLIPPLTSAPFHYPPNVFARVVSKVAANSIWQVVVYVEDFCHVNEFESAFLDRQFQVNQMVSRESLIVPKKKKSDPVSATAGTKTTSNLSSFITLVNGDLLEHQVLGILNCLHDCTNVCACMRFYVCSELPTTATIIPDLVLLNNKPEHCTNYI